MLSVYVTCKNKAEAENIAHILLGKKLIACANIFPVQSMFRWKGKIEKRKEYTILAKTTKEKFSYIAATIKSAHSYTLPVISAHEERTTPDVEEWIKREL